MFKKVALEKIKQNKKTKGTSLDLSKLELTEIPEELNELYHLTELNLSNNNIKEVKRLESLINLELLFLHQNQLECIKELALLPKVRIISLYDNNIKNIPLEILNLNLPIDFSSKAKGHNGILLIGNPIVSPPPEILLKGNEAIKSYLENLVESKNLNEVKTILVGEGASGKTSLVNRFTGNKFNPYEGQTHGIKISKKSHFINKEKLTINFWDFGGQEIMHATHQFFLTKRSVYLLVIDSRKDEKAEYWLRHIKIFGDAAPVIIVINKIDQNQTFDLDRKYLLNKFPNIKAFYKVSCKTNQGIPELKNYLIHCLLETELRKTPFPKNWFTVKEQLQKLKENFITYEKYQEICLKYEIEDPIGQKTLLNFLNDLGIVLNYEKLKLYSTYILNPHWLTNAVYRIINSSIVANADGKFQLTTLEKIFEDRKYGYSSFYNESLKFPIDKYLFIIAIMKEFELIYQINDKQYIIPELLPIQQNKVELKDYTFVIRLVIEYPDFIPTSIIPRLMVKMHDHIYQNRVWKTGMVLEEKLIFNCIANINLDKETNKIDIEVAGERSRDFLTVIRQTIKQLNESFHHLSINEWIPLIGSTEHEKEETLVEYEELLGYEESNVDTYFSGKLRKKFLVSELLNGIETPESRINKEGLQIFISYSKQDEKYKEELCKHLMALVRLNKLVLWTDRSIDSGKEWEEEIFKNIEKSDIVLCLISSDFISSDFCYTKQLQSALEMHNAKKQIVIPIRIRVCDWEKLPISEIQGLPDQWLNDLNDDKAWTSIVKGVEVVINKIQQTKYSSK